ncbi:MAG: molybdopterin-guanine dinucleotide biosynthesis protein A, partial [Rhodospirillaceae bacterium]|nr:molybdopterin-guanine dinucleotide biosynthesis protein A [Rhodospirillaceae bacterium]
SARASALFRNLAVEDIFTFFDLARMLGFERITVSDGKTYSHRIELR